MGRDPAAVGLVDPDARRARPRLRGRDAAPRGRGLGGLHDRRGRPPAARGVPVAGLGHRPRRARRCATPASAPSTPRSCGRPTGSCTRRSRSPGDWAVRTPELAPGRLGLRVRERPLPGRRRHRRRRARAATLPPRPRGRRPRPGLDGRHAVAQRRLGRLRRRQRGLLALQAPVLRLRQGDRRAERRRHARTRSRRSRPRPASTTRCAAGSTGCCASRRPTAPGSAAGASTTSTAPAPRCPRSRPAESSPATPRSGAQWRGSTRCRTRTAASARTSAPTPIRAWRGRGTSTPSQTAWALLAYVAADEADSQRAPGAPPNGYAARNEQMETGTRTHYTGTGFPLDFMIRYHLYRLHFPLLALGRLRERLDSMKFPLAPTVQIAQVRRAAAAQGRALPARPDARADARLQHRLHRLREDPRVRVEQGAPVGRGVHRRGRAVPGAGRLDLRRRAARLQGDRGGRRGLPRAEQDDRALHERAPARAVPRRLRAEQAADVRRPPRRDARDPRLHLRLPGPLGHRGRRDQAGAREAASASRRTRRSSRRPTRSRSSR